MTGALADTTVADFVDQMNVNFMGAVTMTKGEPLRGIYGNGLSRIQACTMPVALG